MQLSRSFLIQSTSLGNISFINALAFSLASLSFKAKYILCIFAFISGHSLLGHFALKLRRQAVKIFNKFPELAKGYRKLYKCLWKRMEEVKDDSGKRNKRSY